MLIDFRSADRLLGLKAIGIYRQGINTAKTACEKVYVSTMQLLAEDTAAEAVQDWMIERLDEIGLNETRTLDMASALCLTLRTACSVYLGQLTKLTDRQTDLLVPTEDTLVVVSQIQSLCDRLSGQTEFASTQGATLTLGFDDVSVTITPESATKAIENIDTILAESEKKKRKGGKRAGDVSAVAVN